MHWECSPFMAVAVIAMIGVLVDEASFRIYSVAALAVHFRHLQIHDDQIHQFAILQIADGLCAVADQFYRTAGFCEHIIDQFLVDLIVLGNEEMFSGQQVAAIPLHHADHRRLFLRFAAIPERQMEMEYRSLSKRAPGLDLTALKMQELFTDGQAKPRTAIAPGNILTRL